MEENNNMCKKCGYRPIDYSESKYSILCTSCREEQIRYKIPKVLLGVITIVLAVSVVLSIITLPKTLNDYRLYKTVFDKISSGNLNELAGSNKIDIDVDDAVDIYIDSINRGQYDFALEFYNKYLESRKVDDSDYNRIEDNSHILDLYYNTCQEYGEKAKSLSKEDISTNDYITQMSAFLNDMLSKGTYDNAVIYCYLGAMSLDKNQSIDYYEKSIKEDNNFSESKVELANLYRRDGDMDKAEKILNEVIKLDRCNSSALRSLAVINLLKNNNKQAVKFAKEAYNTNSTGYYVYETLIIALQKDGQKGESKKYIDKYLSLGYELDEDTEKLLNDKMTLNQYYLENKGEA